MPGSSTQGAKTGLILVADLAAAKPVYAALLGVAPQTDGPYYVGFEVADRRRSGWSERWPARHDLTGHPLAGARHRGQAGRGDRRRAPPERSRA